MSRLQWIGAAMLMACALVLFADRTRFFIAWLCAWWFCLGVLLGALGNQCIHALTGGNWGVALLPATQFLARRTGWLVLLFLPLLFSLHALFPWVETPIDHGFKHWWLSPAFFCARAIVYLLLWWVLARVAPIVSLRRGRAAAVLVAYGVGVTLAAIDWLASLTPDWYSSSFGLVVGMGQFFAGSAFAVWFVTRRADSVPHTEGVPVWRDLGNLLMMYVLMWAYLAFTQFQIIWAENLPHEIGWYVPRLQTSWMWVGVALVLLHFFVPLILLLIRDIKDSPRKLGWLALAMLAVHGLDVIWLVAPSVLPHDWMAPVLAAFATLAMSLLLWGDAIVPATSLRTTTMREMTHA